MATLQQLTGWRLWSLGGPAGWHEQTRQHLLEHLRRRGWQPEKLTLREEDGARPFEIADAVQPMRGPWPGGLLLEGAGFDAWMDLGRRPAVELRCQGGTLADLASWADRLFAELTPDFAWLVPWNGPAPAGLETVLDELQAATGPGRDVATHGPAGPGLVTWIGPGTPAALCDAVSRVSEMQMSQPAAGLLRFDLAPGAQASIEDLLRRWPAARDACTATGWFARPARDALGRETWLAGSHWTAASRAAPRVAGPPPAVAATGAADQLAAAARGGTPVQGLKLAQMLAPGADWRRLRAEAVDLQRADLEGADLRDTTLVDCDFDHARLERAKFDAADLDQVRLRHAHASSLSLAGATLTHCFLQHAVLTDADFGGVLLRGCHAVGIDAERANFEGALLEDVDFSGANLRGARFVRAVLRGCCLDSADLRGADWTAATLVDCSKDGATT